jgi:precorrin-6Y C5,15-methyltransferase (decarboxylating)
VGIECARFGAAVIAVEQDAEQCTRARENAAAHGVALELVHGRAPHALEGLPDPDAVFVGGAGDELAGVLEQAGRRARRAVVVTLATLERVVPAGEALEGSGFEVETVMLQAARLRGLAGLHGLAAVNPVFLVSGARP